MKQTKPKKDIPQKVKDLSAFISAVIVIGGALIGAGQWIVHEINLSTNSRMDAIEKKIDDNQAANELATTRLELINLIQYDSDNIVEITKLGRHYFHDLNGDTWASSVMSKWCAEHNVNCGEILVK